MKMAENKKGNALVLHVSERIDSITSPELEHRINDLVARGERTIVVDLSGVSYISSAGLRVFLASAKKIKGLNGAFRLCSLGGMVREVFVMSGFADILAIYETEEKALSDG